MRRRIYKFLLNKVYGVPEGAIINKSLLIIHRILFPIHSLKLDAIREHYNFTTDVYTIEGVKMSGEFIRMLNPEGKKGYLYTYEVTATDDGVLVSTLVDTVTKKRTQG